MDGMLTMQKAIEMKSFVPESRVKHVLSGPEARCSLYLSHLVGIFVHLASEVVMCLFMSSEFTKTNNCHVY